MDEKVNWPNTPELWNVLSRCEDRWKFTYPGLDVPREVLRMGEWLESVPRSRWPKKNWARFMTSWLARNQAALERAEAREIVVRQQRRQDASVGRYQG